VYAFISSQAAVFPVIAMCRVLSVSRSCYYDWRKQGFGAGNASVAQTEAQVTEAFMRHKRRYGVRRLVPELLDEGLKIGHFKVRRILKQKGLKAIQPKSFVPRTTDSKHPYPISPNLLKDKSPPSGTDQVWVGDITYIPLKAGGWCYLAVWMDLFSRRVTGWQLQGHLKEALIMEAFHKSWGSRKAGKGLIVHSDRGGQYAGNIFRRLLDRYKVIQSMSDADNPYDNAFMESYFSRFKAELLQGGSFEGLENARLKIFEYIEMYYNPIRRHSALGYISPVAFERKMSYPQKTEA
jgi:putative transposase